MSATIQHETDRTSVMQVTGTLLRSDLARAQDARAEAIAAGIRPRLLVNLEDFDGWEARADGGDLEIPCWHSGEIARIAIVGDPQWESQALAFAGAGFHTTPAKFFPTPQRAEARPWLEA